MVAGRAFPNHRVELSRTGPDLSYCTHINDIVWSQEKEAEAKSKGTEKRAMDTMDGSAGVYELFGSPGSQDRL